LIHERSDPDKDRLNCETNVVWKLEGKGNEVVVRRECEFELPKCR